MGLIQFSDGTLLDAQGIRTKTFSDQATDGNDSFLGSSYAESINGLAGNDTIVAENGNNTLFGAAGNVSLDGGAGIDSLIGTASNDT